MVSYSRAITEFWRAFFLGADVLLSGDGFVVASDPELPDDRRVLMLETADGTLHAVLTPAMADTLGLASWRGLTPSSRVRGHGLIRTAAAGGSAAW